MHSPCQPPASTSGLGATHWWYMGYVPPRQPHPRRPHARCCNSYQISAQSDAGPRWRDNATPGALPSRPRPAGTRGGSLLVRLSHSADAGISATMPEFPALWAGSVAPPLLRFCRRNHQRYSYLQRNPTSTRLRGTPYAFLKAAHARVAQAHQALQQRRRGSSRLSLTPLSPSAPFAPAQSPVRPSPQTLPACPAGSVFCCAWHPPGQCAKHEPGLAGADRICRHRRAFTSPGHLPGDIGQALRFKTGNLLHVVLVSLDGRSVASTCATNLCR